MVERWRSILSGDGGSALVEYAIVLVTLMTILFGIMDFSRYLYTYHFVGEVAREATRYATVRGSTFASKGACSSSTIFQCYATTSNVTSYVRGLAPTGIISSSIGVATTWPGAISGASGSCSTTSNTTTGTDDNPGCLVKVVVTYPFKFSLPFLPASATTYTVSSTSEVVIVQ